MANINQICTKALIAVIHFYRLCLRAVIGHYACRFEPSCSTYALDALKKYGCWKGCYWIVRRILRCHPWHQGGIDPIP